MTELHLPVNWTEKFDDVTQESWNENAGNMWLDRDISFAKDPAVWKKDMSDAEKVCLVKALAGLTLLDTKQGAEGMPLISLHESDDQVRAVFAWFGNMEHIHAKSYSKIFLSLISQEQIDYYMKDWVKNQKNLQYKANKIVEQYRTIFKPEISAVEKWKAKATAVSLESGLFYSGFFFPLLLGGGWGGKDDKSRMVDTNDMINLIIRDESLHGAYTGWSAWRNFEEELTVQEQEECIEWYNQFMLDLYENEVEYTKELYTELGLVDEVLKFVRYNFNQAFMNLNLDPIFDEEKVNPIVLAGLNTSTKTHDYFSRKSNSYFKANVTPITNRTFDFSRP